MTQLTDRQLAITLASLPDSETKWLTPNSVEMITVDNIDDLPNRKQGIISRAQRFSIVIEEDTSEEHF